MTYLATSDAAGTQDYAQHEFRGRAPSHMVAHREPLKIERPRFVFRQRYLPIEGGRLLLHLTEELEIEVDPSTMTFDVVNWGVQLPCNKAEEIPRQLAHRFLELFSKADAQMLTEQEETAWVKILDRVDFRSFCIDRAAPHYVEGKLLQLEPVCRVEWHDGETTKVPRNVSVALRALEPSNHFGAYVKLGHDNEIRSIERLLILDQV